MRTRQKVSDVKIISLNHKINRKAAIDKDIAWAVYNGADMSVIDKLVDSFWETVSTPVGGTVSRYWNLQRRTKNV